MLFDEDQDPSAIPNFDDDFNNEEDFDGNQFTVLKDEVIFLVQLTHDGMICDNSGLAAVQEALKGFSSFMKSKIISNYRDKVALVLFGSETTNNPLNFKGIDVRMNLELASASRIRQTDELSKNFGSLDVSFDRPSIAEALWICNHMFSETGQSPDTTQRIFIFTTDDNPNLGDPESLKQAFLHAS